MTTAHSRYVLPSFVERTTYGVQETTPYNKVHQPAVAGIRGQA